MNVEILVNKIHIETVDEDINFEGYTWTDTATLF